MELLSAIIWALCVQVAWCTAEIATEAPLSSTTTRTATTTLPPIRTTTISSINSTNVAAERYDDDDDARAHQTDSWSAEQSEIAEGRVFHNVIAAANKKPELKQRLGEVLPLLRSMPLSERINLATLLHTPPNMSLPEIGRMIGHSRNSSLASLMPSLDIVNLIREHVDKKLSNKPEVTFFF